MLGIGLGEMAGGALIALGIFVAFMGWAVLPLIPFALIGAVYATLRYGVPALGHAAVAAERGVVWGVRRALRPVAMWALVEPAAVSARSRGR